MPKKIVLFILALTLCLPVTAFAGSSGFYGVGGYTETTNGYFFDYNNAVLIDANKEIYDDFGFDEFVAGSSLYVPLNVYVGNALKTDIGDDFTPVMATDKMIRDDNVAMSVKVLKGSKYVGDIKLIDSKKLKIKELEAGIYAHIPLVSDYEQFSRSEIKVQMVLSVNGVSYQDTRTTLECYIVGRSQTITRNTVYGAMSPTQYAVSKYYSGEVTFDFGDNITYLTKVQKRGKYYLNLSREPDKDLTDMYPDAYLESYNFLGDEDSFPVTGRLEIPVNRDKFSKKGQDASLYVYQVAGNRLLALGEGVVSFSETKNKLAIKTDSLDHYILSSDALLPDVEKANVGGNILKSGYATVEPYEQAEAAALNGESSTAQAQKSAPGSSSTASRPAANAGQNASPQETDADGYVPEEEELTYNGLDGQTINASNTSAYNPQTSDFAPLSLAFFTMAASAFVVVWLKVKKH